MSLKAPFPIFSYSSYLEYFQDAYAHLHARDEGFSYDQIALACEFKSRTQSRNFIRGTQKPTVTQLRKLAQHFGLDAGEQEYLLCLHQFQAVQGSPAAYALFQNLARIQRENLPAADAFREIEVAASVLHMTLLAVLDLSTPPRSAQEVLERLKDRYSALEVETALAELERFGYLRAQKTGWKIEQKYIRKYDERYNFLLRRYHEQALGVVKDSFENEPPSERYFIGATFSINEKVYGRLEKKINQFVENLMKLEGVAGGSDTVVQVTTQLVRMTRAPGVAEFKRAPVEPGDQGESA